MAYPFRTTLACMAAVLVLGAPARAGQGLENLLDADNLARASLSRVTVKPGPRPGGATLTFGAAEGTLTVPVPQAAADWSRAGALTFNFQSSSTIRWDLIIRNRRGESFTFRVQPYQNVAAKAALLGDYLTRAYLNNHAFKGHWISSWGNHIDMTAVASVEIRMSPDRPVTLEVGPFAWDSEPAQDEVYLDKPLVDAFGQWNAGEWPGKVYTLDQLRAAWQREDAALARPAEFGYSPYGGWKERKDKATGFFHTAQVGGRWWLVDPDGYLFFSSGPDCVRYTAPTPLLEREALFAKLPEDAGDTADFYHANARLRYGPDDFAVHWRQRQWQRLRQWGFNTVANWSDPALFEQPRMPFVVNVSLGNSGPAWQGFPDVFAESWRRQVGTDAIEQCKLYREEPQLIGYFVGNEPRWPYRNLIDLILKDPRPSDTQAFVRRFLAERGDRTETRAALLEALARQYFRVLRGAIRGVDPNHLILGIRWAGNAPDPVLKANDVFDVFSINIYRFAPPRQQIEHLYQLTRRPVLIGEFHFGAPERGMAPGLVMVHDQTERGVAFQYYLEQAAALPPVVGAHYFQYGDEPVSGRYDGENYNIGFVDQTDQPYPEMVRFAQETHRRMYRVHAGALEPVARQARP